MLRMVGKITHNRKTVLFKMKITQGRTSFPLLPCASKSLGTGAMP